MARQRKKGLDYFPSDVGFWDDEKIMELTNEYGPMGVCVYDVTLRQIYRNGYYLQISLETFANLITRIIGSRWIDKSRVLEILHYCGRVGLFDQALMAQGVITSVGIQRRYAEVTARNKVDKSHYWLLAEKEISTNDDSAPVNGEMAAADISAVKTGISVTETGVSATEKEVSATEIPQSKGKKRKEKESKGKESSVKESAASLGIAIPCRNGTFYIDEDFLDELTHTYPNMEVMDSINHLLTYLLSNPEKQRFLNAARGMVAWWVQNDNDNRKYRRSKGFQPTYDIADYESTSVLDEEDYFDDP